MGFTNERHEPPTFYGVERNFVETAIIPSTWREGGVMLRAYHRKIPIKLIIYDDKTDPATSVNLATRLAVQDHVDAMLGGYATDLVQAQTVVPNQYSIPYVNGGGAATAIYHRGFKTVFGLLSSIQNLAFSECDFIESMQAQGKLPKPLKMAVVYENTSHGKDFVDGLTLRAKAKPKNYQIVLNEAFDLHGKDFTPLLQKVKATSANAFMSDAHLDDYITMQRQFKQLGLHYSYVTYGARGPEKAARDALGDGVDYIVAAAWWNSQIPNAAVRAFDVKWAKALRNGADAVHRDDRSRQHRQSKGGRGVAQHRHRRHDPSGRAHPLREGRTDGGAVRRDREPAGRQGRHRLAERHIDRRRGPPRPGSLAAKPSVCLRVRSRHVRRRRNQRRP